MFFELDFELPDNRILEFLFFADKMGHLTGVDVEVSGNTCPVPDEPKIGRLVGVQQSPSNVP